MKEDIKLNLTLSAETSYRKKKNCACSKYKQVAIRIVKKKKKRKKENIRRDEM